MLIEFRYLALDQKPYNIAYLKSRHILHTLNKGYNEQEPICKDYKWEVRASSHINTHIMEETTYWVTGEPEL